MNYVLAIHYRDDGSRAGTTPVLHAELQRLNDGRVVPVSASIDMEPSGGLTVHGINAYRLLCCAELIIAHATGAKVIDPHEEISHLQKEVARLRGLLELEKKEEAV